MAAGKSCIENSEIDPSIVRAQRKACARHVHVIKSVPASQASIKPQGEDGKLILRDSKMHIRGLVQHPPGDLNTRFAGKKKKKDANNNI